MGFPSRDGRGGWGEFLLKGNGRWLFLAVPALLALFFLLPKEKGPGMVGGDEADSPGVSEFAWGSRPGVPERSALPAGLGEMQRPIRDARPTPPGTKPGDSLSSDEYREATDGVAAEERRKREAAAGDLEQKGFDEDDIVAQAGAAAGNQGSPDPRGAGGGVGGAGGEERWAAGGSGFGGGGGGSSGSGATLGGGTAGSSSFLARATSPAGRASSAGGPSRVRYGERGRSSFAALGGAGGGAPGFKASGAGAGAGYSATDGPGGPKSTGSPGAPIGQGPGQATQDKTGPGIGGGIAAPPIGASGPADPADGGAGAQEKRCRDLWETCGSIYADYDAQIASTEGALNNCRTWVNMGKGGMVQTVDQACYDRTMGQLNELRGDRTKAFNECQEKQRQECGGGGG